MKILYINPGRIESGLDSFVKGIPLNLISLAAMVPNHDAKLYDFKVENYDEKRFRRLLNKHDVVAITSLTAQVHSALEVAQMAQEQGCITIIGGYHASLAPDYVIKHPAVDYIIRGEGEHTFKELIDYLDGNKKGIPIIGIDGISYKDGQNEIHHNNNRMLEENLDNFPLPRRDLLKKKVYRTWGLKWDLIETSRGCPHNCSFCCITKMWSDESPRRRYRVKSLKRIMQEVYEIDLNNDIIFFCDDNFTININRTKKILETIIKSGLNNKVGFSCQSRVDTLYKNPDIIDLMEKASMRQVFLGIESIHQQSLDAMNKKNTTPDMVRQVVKNLQDRGITIFGGIILGFPGETKSMVRQTIQYAKELGMTTVQFTPITAFPGTDFYDEMKTKKMITSNNFKHYNLWFPMMKTEQLTNRELYRLVLEAYSSYFLDGDWIKLKAKQFMNPFSKFSSWRPSISQILKTFVDVYGMFRIQGVNRRMISDELKLITLKSKMGINYIDTTPDIKNLSKEDVKDLKKIVAIPSQKLKHIPIEH